MKIRIEMLTPEIKKLIAIVVTQRLHGSAHDKDQIKPEDVFFRNADTGHEIMALEIAVEVER